uniref:Glypican-6 n=1 Tax=Ditylenchus dipsaci TaxID=166011 RepID=A0A915EEC3_9BILA
MRLDCPSKANYSNLLLLLFTLIQSEPCSGQSSCAFMTQINYLDTSDMPAEPVLLASPNASLNHCRPGHSSRTCCTQALELDMQRHVTSQLNQEVNQQLGLLQQFFDEYATKFRDHIKSAIQLTHNQLDTLFQRTYGPFYTSNSQVFSEFFTQLTNWVTTTDFQDSGPYAKVLLEQLFSTIYIQEFSLLNPLRKIGEQELKCMRDLESDLHPFGSIPSKMNLMLTRSWNAWKSVLKVLQTLSTELAMLTQTTSLSMECSSALTRMQQCQMCSGEDPLYSKPCFNLCSNVLKGCFAELAEMDGQFNFLLAPLAIQISEAIIESQSASTQPTSSALTTYYYYHENRALKFDVLRRSVIDFVDKLTRLKGFWRSMSTSMCRETGIAASPGQQCWNGTAMSRYSGKYVGHRVHNQRHNPEFPNYKGIKETFTRHKLKFALSAVQLDASYNQQDVDYAEAIEGSASDESKEYEEPELKDVSTKAIVKPESKNPPPVPPTTGHPAPKKRKKYEVADQNILARVQMYGETNLMEYLRRLAYSFVMDQ